MVAILFVCLGNICRSPLAEGVLRALVEEQGSGAAVQIDSAGLGGWHVGEAPDRRSIAVARRHGIDISGLRGRKVGPADFGAFDWILGMDRDNVASLMAQATPGCRARVELFLGDADVPDPYYGTDEAFEQVYGLIATGARGLLSRLQGQGL